MPKLKEEGAVTVGTGVAKEAVDLRVLVLGFEQAFGRFISRAGESEADLGPPFIPLFEALNWAITIDDRLRRDRDDSDWWKRLADGAVVRGVRFARNRVHHQWADALGEPGTGRAAGRILPWPLHWGVDPYKRAAWRWKPSLPPGSPGKEDPLGEQLYADYLARRMVRDTLQQLYAMFRTLPEIQQGSTRGFG